MTVLAVLVYLAIGTSSVLLITRVSAHRRRHPADGRVHDVYEAAFLSGGPARVVDAALAALHADGRLTIGGPGIVSVRNRVAHDPVERAVLDQLAAAPTGALHALRLEVMRGPAVQEIGHGLAARGLMVTPGQNRGLTVWGVTQSILSLLALPVAVVLTVITFLGDGPYESRVPFIVMVLPALIAGILTGFIMADRARRRISPAGLDAIRAYRDQYAQTFTPAQLVALHGLRAVPDPMLQAQLTSAARIPTTSGGHSAPYADSAAMWCAGSSPGSGCGGSSCGGSSGGGSSCGGSSGGGSSCGGSSGGSSCGGSSGGGSSCGSSSS